MWCRVSTRLHAQYLPQGKEKLLLRDILCLKRRSYLRQHFTQTESHEANITVETESQEANITVGSPSKWTSNTRVVETSESIEPNDTDLELNAIGYTFSKIF